MPVFAQHEVAPHDWARMVASLRARAAANAAFAPIADVCAWLAASPYRDAGLYGVLSMHDVIVGPSQDVLANPHLVISFLFDERMFALLYADGSAKPWRRAVDPSEIEEVLSRFFVRRARWYRTKPSLRPTRSAAVDHPLVAPKQ
jgi:hypothetical protein